MAERVETHLSWVEPLRKSLEKYPDLNAANLAERVTIDVIDTIKPEILSLIAQHGTADALRILTGYLNDYVCPAPSLQPRTYRLQLIIAVPDAAIDL